MKQTRFYEIVTEVKCVVTVPIEATSIEEAADKYRNKDFNHSAVKVAAVTGNTNRRGLENAIKKI